MAFRLPGHVSACQAVKNVSLFSFKFSRQDVQLTVDLILKEEKLRSDFAKNYTMFDFAPKRNDDANDDDDDDDNVDDHDDYQALAKIAMIF